MVHDGHPASVKRGTRCLVKIFVGKFLLLIMIVSQGKTSGYADRVGNIRKNVRIHGFFTRKMVAMLPARKCKIVVKMGIFSNKLSNFVRIVRGRRAGAFPCNHSYSVVSSLKPTSVVDVFPAAFSAAWLVLNTANDTHSSRRSRAEPSVQRQGVIHDD